MLCVLPRQGQHVVADRELDISMLTLHSLGLSHSFCFISSEIRTRTKVKTKNRAQKTVNIEREILDGLYSLPSMRKSCHLGERVHHQYSVAGPVGRYVQSATILQFSFT
jgi:hypothetical protein